MPAKLNEKQKWQNIGECERAHRPIEIYNNKFIQALMLRRLYTVQIWEPWRIANQVNELEVNDFPFGLVAEIKSKRTIATKPILRYWMLDDATTHHRRSGARKMVMLDSQKQYQTKQSSVDAIGLRVPHSI